jgi:hypothetical protein
MTKYRERIFLFLLFLILFVWLGSHAYKRHANIAWNDWQTEITADGAGYYIYLPMWFDQGYEASHYRKGLDKQLGNGFSLDDPSGIVRTKYFSGTALMLSPFYLIWSVISDDDPFSDSFNRMVSWASALVVSFGALLLFQVSRRRSGNFASLFAVWVGIFGSTIVYYVIQNPMWSHAWSFSVVCILLFLFHRRFEKREWLRIAGMGIFSALLIMIRPTNLLLLIPIWFFEPEERPVLNLRHVLIFVLCAALVCMPQLIYWKKLSGSWFYDAYSGEGFHYLRAPRFLSLLFEPRSGLLSYTPLFVLFWLLLFSKTCGRPVFRYVLLAVQLVLMYLFASWSTLNFGECCFGFRSFTEMVPLYIPLLATFMRRTYYGIHSRRWILAGAFAVLCVSWTTQLTGKFYHCYLSSHPFDFREFRRYLFDRVYHFDDAGHPMNPEVKRKMLHSSGASTGPSVFMGRDHYFRNVNVRFELPQLPDTHGVYLHVQLSHESAPRIYGPYRKGKHLVLFQLHHAALMPEVNMLLMKQGLPPDWKSSKIQVLAD